MNDKVRYLVEMDPTMTKGIALFRLSFPKSGVTEYDFMNTEGEFEPLDESEWNGLNRYRMAEVTEAIVAEWKESNPLGYDTVASYVV